MVFQYAVVKKAWLDIHYHARSLFLYGKISEWRCDSVKKKQDLSHKR